MIKSLVLIAVLGVFTTAANAADNVQQREVKTQYYSLALTPDGSTIESLSVDSLGKGEFRPNALLPPGSWPVARTFPQDPAAGVPDSGWRFKFSPRSFEMVSTFRHGIPGQGIVVRFNPEVTHATLLTMVDEGQARLPAVLHLPEEGSLRIEVASRQPVLLGYDGHRRNKGYVEVFFPGATLTNPRVAYTFTVVAIYPHLPGIESDPRFDGFRRNWLNIFQMQAEDGMLANNTASDPCSFVEHMYTELAKYTPPLANGLTAMDLVRESLDRFLHGALAAGMPYYRSFDGSGFGVSDRDTVSADTHPSLLIAAGEYVSTTHDTQWLRKNYPALRDWAEAMLATDTNGDGLVKYSASGNSNSWIPRADGGTPLRPANWWDTIGFGYEDAYSNALAYRALGEMTAMASLMKRDGDAARYRKSAAKLKSAYLPAFFDEKTGVIAGWRSEDGKLHDYYFPWVNGAAVVYGLVPKKEGSEIFDHLLAKMNEVGYTDFEHGIPGNLIPISQEDYLGHARFQNYEDGSATAAFAYYTIAALYKLGRVQDGDRILFPMLKSYKAGGYDGRGPNGKTYDWQSWNGTPSGYEGFLADCFMTLAAAVERPLPLTSRH
ncbi:MAG TPA: hypothetical protein VFW30_09720 [Bryocella sp.]|nr:hypothetical protein [Bryocella sp.]